MDDGWPFENLILFHIPVAMHYKDSTFQYKELYKSKNTLNWGNENILLTIFFNEVIAVNIKDRVTFKQKFASLIDSLQKAKRILF